MKVLNLIQGTNLGGMEKASFNLMTTMQRRGFEFEVLSLNAVGELAPLLQSAGIQVTGLKYSGRGGWKTVRPLAARLRQSNADALLMTGHHLLGSIVSWTMKSRRSILAIHFHHAGVKPKWQWRMIYAVARHRFDAITFPTDFIRHEAEVLFPPVRQIAKTVRNPVAVHPCPSDEQRAQARRTLGLRAATMVVGNAGWLIRRKRWDVFLHVARLVCARHPEAVFVIAGDGPERSHLQSLAAELGVDHAIRWLGWQTDLSSFYSAIDVLLFNSDIDALGLTPLEAMSRGIPVVASVEQGGLSEILRDGRDGVLLSRHDTEHLAGSIEKLLTDKAYNRALGLAGRQRIAEACDPDKTADAYANLFLGHDSPKYG
jgi:glycosyltransferase involved in cell wall biosynthesis